MVAEVVVVTVTVAINGFVGEVRIFDILFPISSFILEYL